MMTITHMLFFLGSLFVLLGLEHVYIFIHLSNYLHLTGGMRRIVAVLCSVLFVVAISALPAARYLSRAWAEPFVWVSFSWMGISLLLLLALLAIDLAWLFYRMLPVTPAIDPERRIFLQRAFGFAAVGATGLVSGYSFWKGLRPVAVKPLTINLGRLPQAFDGLRIVQITDLHIGPMIDGRWLGHIVDQVNDLQPDIIAVTGDLVDGSVEDLKEHVAALARLTAPHGVYFITGNHEYYSGVEPWCAHIADLGLRVLRNERVTIGKDGASFDLAGVDDWAAHRFPGEGADLAKALTGRDPDKALILLAHQPATINEAAENGVDLQISGHTHGGQIWPFGYFVHMQQPYIKGLHRHLDTATQIYVSEGTGYWGPPMRLGTSAEITEIILRAG